MAKASKRPASHAVEMVSPIKRSKKSAFGKKGSVSNKVKPKKSENTGVSETANSQKPVFKNPGDVIRNVEKKSFDKNVNTKQKSFGKPIKKGTFPKQNTTQTVNWAEYKKKKKELRTKRRENKDLCDVLPKAKQLGEKIRRKTLEGGKGGNDSFLCFFLQIIDVFRCRRAEQNSF